MTLCYHKPFSLELVHFCLDLLGRKQAGDLDDNSTGKCGITQRERLAEVPKGKDSKCCDLPFSGTAAVPQLPGQNRLCLCPQIYCSDVDVTDT